MKSAGPQTVSRHRCHIHGGHPRPAGLPTGGPPGRGHAAALWSGSALDLPPTTSSGTTRRSDAPSTLMATARRAGRPLVLRRGRVGCGSAWSLGVDGFPAPFLGGNVGEGLGERPLVAGGSWAVNCRSPYSKSVGSVRIRAPWARARSQWACASSTRTITEWVTSPGRGGRRSPRTSPTITAPSPNRSWARWFSPIRNSFGEAERRRQPGDGLGDVGVDQDGDDRGGRDGAVGFHTGRFNPCRELRDIGRRPPGHKPASWGPGILRCRAHRMEHWPRRLRQRRVARPRAGRHR